MKSQDVAGLGRNSRDSVSLSTLDKNLNSLLIPFAPSFGRHGSYISGPSVIFRRPLGFLLWSSFTLEQNLVVLFGANSVCLTFSVDHDSFFSGHFSQHPPISSLPKAKISIRAFVYVSIFLGNPPPNTVRKK